MIRPAASPTPPDRPTLAQALAAKIAQTRARHPAERIYPPVGAHLGNDRPCVLSPCIHPTR